MLRLALFAIIGAVALFVAGMSEMGDVNKYRHPTVLTYDQFVKQSPSEGWYTIKGGVLNLLDIAEKTENSSHEEYYVALIGPHDDPFKATAHVVVVPHDPSLDQTMQDNMNLGDNPSDQALKAFMKSHRGTLFVQRDITGMSQHSWLTGDQSTPPNPPSE